MLLGVVGNFCADRFLGTSRSVVSKFYKYLVMWGVIGGIFLLTICILYFPKQSSRTSLTLQDIVRAANEPVGKKKRILKKHETRCRVILEEMFQSPFTSIRPDELKYPKTGRNLELDGYNKEYNIAFEYQGIQHRKHTPMFHQSYQDFLDQLARDEYKKNRCEELGIQVIYIPDTVPYDKLDEYLREQVEKMTLK